VKDLLLEVLSLHYFKMNDHKKVAIWGRAQHEAARHLKPDWGTGKGLKFRSQQSHVAGTQLHYHIGYLYSKRSG